MIKLSVIIVNYNVKFFLEQAIRSILLAVEDFDAEMIVVDNASFDGSVEMVQSLFPQVKIIANEKNLGFAKANNIALQECKGQYVCLINPDTITDKDTFKICLDYLDKHHNTGALGCKVLNPDGSLQPACRRSFPTPWAGFSKISGLSRIFPKSRLFGRYNLTYLDPDMTSEVEALSGSFMIVRQETINQVGFLDERFFMYGEDIDWCYRIIQKGWKIIYLPETQIIHYKGESTKEADFDQVKMFYTAMNLFVSKHFDKGWKLIPQWFLHLGILSRGFLSQIKNMFNHWSPIFGDLISIQAGLVFAHVIRFGSLVHLSAYLLVDAIYTFLWIFILIVMGIYRKSGQIYERLIAGMGIGLILNSSITFFMPQYAFSRKVLVLNGIFALLFSISWRLILNRIKSIVWKASRRPASSRRRLLMLGFDRMNQKIFNHLQNAPKTIYEPVGYLAWSRDDLKCADHHLPILGILSDIRRVIHAHHVHAICFSAILIDESTAFNLRHAIKDLPVEIKLVHTDNSLNYSQSLIDYIAGAPFAEWRININQPVNVILKRSVDIFAALILLIPWIISRFFVFWRKSYYLSKKKVHDGYGSYLSVTLVHSRNNKIKWPSLSFVIPLLKGHCSLLGSELEYFSNQKSVGYKPGIINIKNIISDDGILNIHDTSIYRYMTNYSIVWDIRLLLKAISSIFKRRLFFGEIND